MLYVEPDENDAHFYRNAQADELVYVSKGSGTLETLFGDLPYQRGRLPRHPPRHPAPLPAGSGGRADQAADHGKPRPRALAQALPERVRAAHRGRAVQRARHPPARPQLRTHDERGDFPILVKQYDGLNEIILDHHPFDVVGWDGYFYPWAFNIHDFEPIVGRVHQPPPVHQTFQGDGFVVCSFCPRPYDFHPEAVPAPYNHSNVDSDEVLYYASSEFMSRKGIEFGSITHHPDGIPHGPHPGRAEASIGAKYTEELAVMMDTLPPAQGGQAGDRDRGPGLPQVLARRAARAVQSAYFMRPEVGEVREEMASWRSEDLTGADPPLWIPVPERIARANLTAFMKHMHKEAPGRSRAGRRFRLSLSLVGGAAGGVLARGLALLRRRSPRSARRLDPWDQVVIGLDRMAPPDPVLGPRWFPGARLNFAENLLRYQRRPRPRWCSGTSGAGSGS